jgi:RimJ/RimL family protein N-acetyltransferase
LRTRAYCERIHQARPKPSHNSTAISVDRQFPGRSAMPARVLTDNHEMKDPNHVAERARQARQLGSIQNCDHHALTATPAPAGTAPEPPLLGLMQIAVGDLRLLALSQVPAWLLSSTLAEAMPPPFVADRSLQQLGAGKPQVWCAPFYMLRSSDALVVGSCGFKDMPTQGRVEIAYGVAPEARRQGMAGAAVAQLLRIAGASDAVFQVLAQVSPTNIASTRVVQRLGFLPCGQQLDHAGEMLVQWVCRVGRVGQHAD